MLQLMLGSARFRKAYNQKQMKNLQPNLAQQEHRNKANRVSAPSGTAAVEGTQC
jgi:hypothetical protein